MKGQIVYTKTVEEEVEIPDELIELAQKRWHSYSEEDDKRFDELVESVWGKIPWENRCGMYYGENFKFYIVEY